MNMKSLAIKIAIPVLALGLMGGTGIALAGAASASTGQSNGQTAKLTGNNGAAVYVDGVFGPVKCNETQHPKFDTVSCRFTAGQTQTPGTSGTFTNWYSDFNDRANSGTLTYTINADGTGYTGQATYPNG